MSSDKYNVPRLFIAEKPSLGRAIADVLPKPHKKEEGYILAGNGDIVSWCIGHLLEQAEPDAYDPGFKQWKSEDLPIIPQDWKLVAKSKTRKQLSILKKLIKNADDIIHAGDPDREGQLLVDEVINHSRLSKSKVSKVQRCLISDLNPSAVSKAVGALKSNKEFIPLSVSALARQRADWLYGINLTRQSTIQGRHSGYQGVLSVGRVQTPLLGLVVRRDLEIENFVSKPFYEVEVTLQTELKEVYLAKWKPSEACQPYMDEEGRVLSRKLAENVISRVQNQSGHVLKVNNKLKKQPPPLPYNLSSLQIDASKRFNMSAKMTLDTCQALYEKHKLITYPRSDCRYLPNEHFTERASVLKAVSKTLPEMEEAVENADTTLKTKAWSDQKVGAHHAIIPTSKTGSYQRLTSDEQKIYQLIATQYLMQFYSPFVYKDKQVDTEVAGGLFISRTQEVQEQGWKSLIRKSASPTNEVSDNTDSNTKKLPDLKDGDKVECIDTFLKEKQTTPPKYFTDATLLSAMTGISRYVSNPEIRKVLRETDGLGTEATRAGIIELLFKRSFLTRQGKEIRSTQVGRSLINTLPESMTQPDMTAQWESQLMAISEKQVRYLDFMQPLYQQLESLVADVGKVTFEGMKGMGKLPRRKKSRYPKKPAKAN